MGAGCYQIAKNPKEPVYDQRGYISWAQSSSSYFYHYETALSYFYFLKAFNLVAPNELVKFNTGLRILALLLYIGTGSLLFYSMLQRHHVGFFILFVFLLFSARFAFLWNSIEVFSASALMLVLWAIYRKIAFSITALFVTIFIFSKPDLIFSGTMIALFLAYRSSRKNKERMKNILLFSALCFLVLLPCFVKNGKGSLTPRWRNFFTFKQHYASLVSVHQIKIPRPNPWKDYDKYYYGVWGKQKLWPAIKSNPSLYVDFIFLSLGRTIINSIHSNVAYFLPLAIYCLWLTKKKRNIHIIVYLFLLGFIPITLLSYGHVRYFARYYPLIIFIIILGFLEISKRRGDTRLFFLYLSPIALFQTFQCRHVFMNAYWFPYW